jgi:hypothetical protein
MSFLWHHFSFRYPNPYPAQPPHFSYTAPNLWSLDIFAVDSFYEELSFTDDAGSLTDVHFTELIDDPSKPDLFMSGATGTVCGILEPVCLTTPIPPALPLFATGLAGLGLLGWRRKRKANAA